MCWNKVRLYWKIAKLFYFCHLKKLVRPETFGPYHVYQIFRCQLMAWKWSNGQLKKKRVKFYLSKTIGHERSSYFIFMSVLHLYTSESTLWNSFAKKKIKKWDSFHHINVNQSRLYNLVTPIHGYPVRWRLMPSATWYHVLWWFSTCRKSSLPSPSG